MSDITLAKIIAANQKKTPCTAYIRFDAEIDLPGFTTFGSRDKIIFGEYNEICTLLDQYSQNILYYHIVTDRRFSAVPMADYSQFHARIEPGAHIREGAQIGDNSVILMGAVINTGASIGKNTMVDMNAVIGGGAIIGENCHIGACSVIAGMVEPTCDRPVKIEDNVFVGAGAVICEGVTVHKGASVGAGAVVLQDVPENCTAVGVPARIVKKNTSFEYDRGLRNL